MVKKLKLPRKKVEEILKNDPALTPDERTLVREIFEDAIRIGLMKR